MADDIMYLIYLHGAQDAHREAVQQIVKAHTKTWWHHLPDLWIVGGHNHSYWGDLIKPILALSEAGLLVLELPNDKDNRMFAIRGTAPASMIDWLWTTYLGRSKPGAKATDDKPALTE